MYLPAERDVSMLRVVRCCTRFEIGDIEVGKCVVDEAVHRASLTEHVLVDEPRYKV